MKQPLSLTKEPRGWGQVTGDLRECQVWLGFKQKTITMGGNKRGVLWAGLLPAENAQEDYLLTEYLVSILAVHFCFSGSLSDIEPPQELLKI